MPPAGADDLRPPRGSRGDDEATSGRRHAPDWHATRRNARCPGHRCRDGWRRLLHADAGRPEPRGDPRRGPVSLPERPNPSSRDADEYATERCLPRVWCTADGVRGRNADEPTGGGAGHLAARHPPAQRLPGGRHDAYRPGAPRQRRRGGSPRARGRGRRIRADARADRARPRRRHRQNPARLRHRAGTCVARRGVHWLGRGEARERRFGGADGGRFGAHPHGLDRDGAGDQDDLSAARSRHAGHSV